MFQRYCKDFYFLFTEAKKLKFFQNLFKMFMKIFENFGSLKVKGICRFP